MTSFMVDPYVYRSLTDYFSLQKNDVCSEHCYLNYQCVSDSAEHVLYLGNPSTNMAAVRTVLRRKKDADSSYKFASV